MATARQALRARREQLGLSQEEIARTLHVSTFSYRSWEAGESLPRLGRRQDLARALSWTTAQLASALDGDRPMNSHAVPEWLTLYASLEQAAAHIWAWQPVTVHALLQTPDYAASVERIGPVRFTREDIDRRVSLRMNRQRVLHRKSEPLRLSVVLDESVLRRVTGSPEIMAEQLNSLADTAPRGNIHIQVVPLVAGVHSAAFGTFTLLQSPGAGAPQMVCVEDRTGHRYLESEHAIKAHSMLFDHLCDVALPPAESIELIRHHAKETYR